MMVRFENTFTYPLMNLYKLFFRYDKITYVRLTCQFTIQLVPKDEKRVTVSRHETTVYYCLVPPAHVFAVVASNMSFRLNALSRYLCQFTKYQYVQFNKRSLATVKKNKLEDNQLKFLPHSSQVPEKFPLINPWRSNQVTGQTENEIQTIRHQELDSNFPTKNFPSISQVLQGSMSEASHAALNNWKVQKTAELGEVGFIEHQRKIFSRGSALHQRIMLQLTGSGQIVVPKEIENYWKSLKGVFPDVNDVELLEKRVYHPFLCYKGVFDCLAKYKGELVVIDWKTSSKPKPTMAQLYDEPLQTAAYTGAINYDPSLTYNIDKFVVVIAYESGEPATVHAFSSKVCQEYWNYYLKRLTTYWTNRSKN